MGNVVFMYKMKGLGGNRIAAFSRPNYVAKTRLSSAEQREKWALKRIVTSKLGWSGDPIGQTYARSSIAEEEAELGPSHTQRCPA